jgi:tetratricopeptide (TPR) repeat protein
MKLGRMKDALKEVELALREKTKGIDGKSLLRRVQILKELGEYDEADSEAKKLLDLTKNQQETGD